MSTTHETTPNAPTRPVGMTASSGVADMSAAGQRRRADMVSGDARRLAPIAILRWEAEGGALGISHP